MLISDEVEKLTNELEKSLNQLEELEIELSRLTEKWPLVKSKADQIFYEMLSLELKANPNPKASFSQLKERARLRSMLDETYRERIELEERIELLKKRLSLVRTKVDAIKLRIEILKSF